MVLNYYILFSVFLFFVGLVGIFVTRKNIIVILMSLELVLLSVNVNFVLFSSYLSNYEGQVFSLFVLVVAAAESTIGLAILVAYHRLRGTIATFYINSLKG